MGSAFTRVSKTNTDIAREWDALCTFRAAQIESGSDLSFNEVLMPAMLELITGADATRVLDVGCGTGHLAAELGKIAGRVVGIDISPKSIEIARATHHLPTLEFEALSVADLVERKPAPFTAAVAGMAISATLDADDFLRNVNTLLQRSAHLIISMTHPCFWAQYWRYDSEPWFNYWEEMQIEGPFRISSETSDSAGLVSTHIHRPLELYFEKFVQTGFSIHKLVEPKPRDHLPINYRSTWVFPRFILIDAIKI
jgi:SAM-dependent methyltransferase